MPPISELTDASKIQTKSPSELYSLSKMAICLHTVELSRRLKESKETENIKVFAIRPGFIKGKRANISSSIASYICLCRHRIGPTYELFTPHSCEASDIINCEDYGRGYNHFIL